MALTIEELTGARRTLTLDGRALPFRGVAYSATQRTEVTWYPGNPVATMQVLGPSLEPTTMEGRWAERYIRAGFATGDGFDDLDTVAGLVAAIDSLARSGNALRVQWGRETRNGVLERFAATYDREEVVRWSARFAWYGRDDERAPVAQAETRPASEVREAQNGVDDRLAVRPSTPSVGYVARVRAAARGVRSRVGDAYDAIREARQSLGPPIRPAQDLAAASSAIRESASAEISELVDRPYTEAQVSDRVVDVLGLEGWRRGLAGAYLRLSARVARSTRDVARRAVPDAVVVVTMPGHGSLRRLALDTLGDADAWRELARANRIAGSTAAPGRAIIVPGRGRRIEGRRR